MLPHITVYTVDTLAVAITLLIAVLNPALNNYSIGAQSPWASLRGVTITLS